MVIASEVGSMRKLKEYYVNELVPAIMRERSYKNIMEVPRLDKILVNMGVGEAIQNIKVLDSAVEELSLIVGQRPVITRARRSIASFKLREGMAIGCMVTLRRGRMYEFLDRLINVAIPRVRDFRGLNSRAFDGRGNYTLGIREQIIFPEVDYDKIERVKGMNITIVTTAKTDEEGYLLLKLLGMPFRN
jgi:large subunit ribosomal protein L5